MTIASSNHGKINRNKSKSFLFIFNEKFDVTHFRLGDGLLTSHGEKWRSHRKLIAPAFHQLVLKSFIGAFNRNSLRLVERLEKEVGRNEFDVHDYMSEVTVDILLGNDKDIVAAVVHFDLHIIRIKISLVQLFFPVYDKQIYSH